MGCYNKNAYLLYLIASVKYSIAALFNNVSTWDIVAQVHTFLLFASNFDAAETFKILHLPVLKQNALLIDKQRISIKGFENIIFLEHRHHLVCVHHLHHHLQCYHHDGYRL